MDGEHVSLDVQRRTLEVWGPEHFLLMTDRLPGQHLAGRALHKQSGSRLVYNDGGMVAGGSTNLRDQLYSLRDMEVPEPWVTQLAISTPSIVLEQLADRHSRIRDAK